MTCCGKIVNGNINLVIDNIRLLFDMPTERYKLAEVRKAVCRKCEKHTWLSISEYVKWLKDNGIEVIKNLSDLTVLPELPKAEYTKGKKLFCMLCKCWIPAKAENEIEKCPLDKWENING